MRWYFVIFFAVLLLSQNALSATRIINGHDAREGDWPWMVAIIGTGTIARYSQFCGGTLIRPTWVLTAAHCVLGETVNSIEVLTGRNTLSDENVGKVVKVKQIIKHTKYDRDPENPIADIALIELVKPVNLPVVKVLDYHSNMIPVGKNGVMLGWGATQFSNDRSSKYSDILKQVTLPIISNAICNQSYTNDVTETMLCAGFAAGGQDACAGDSGGPLVVQTDSGWQQIGIMSWGEGCALPEYYGVYTHVPSYQDFIADNACESRPVAVPQLTVSIDEHNVTVAWTKITEATGYQFYYAPHITPLDYDLLNATKQSIDLGDNNSFTLALEVVKAFPYNFYVAVRAYQDNCYSTNSNLGEVILP